MDVSDSLFKERNLKTLAGAAYTVPAIELIYRFGLKLRADITRINRSEVCALKPDALVDLFVGQLSKRLSQVLHKAVILEINVARTLGQLSGETPEQRFADYVRQMQEKTAREKFFADYPALAEITPRMVEYWYDASLEFITRLNQDFSELNKTFGSLGPLIGFANQSGDSHNRGRSVMIAVFQTGARIVYKPHDIQVDARFQEFLSWLGEKGFDDPYILKVIPREGYGWTEFVSYRACAKASEVDGFYLRTGQLLSALHLLGATDMHSENLIARAAHPVAVDVETLLHPHVLQSNKPVAADTAQSLLQKEIYSSVIKTELLPKLKGDNPRSSADTSGLGGQAKQATAIKGRTVTDMGTDQIRVVETTFTTGQTQNRPMVAGQDKIPPLNGDLLVQGFDQGYRILMNNREELNERLEKFRNVHIRAVPRNSSTYFGLLQDSYHPDVLGPAGGREEIFAGLEAVAKTLPLARKLIPSELTQLLEGDIPYFHTVPDSNDLTGGDGLKIPASVAESGWSILQDKLKKWGPADLALQKSIIRGSMAGLMGFNEVKLSPFRPSQTSDQFLDAAVSVGDHLLESAYRGHGSVSWLVLESKGRHELLNANVYQPAPAGADLYNGLSGIAFFLHYLGNVTGDTRYRETVKQILPALERIPLNANSAFNGAGSLLYLYSHLDLRERVQQLAARMNVQQPDSVFDIVGGAAGVILALIAAKSDRARKFGDKLQLHLESGGKLPIERGFSHGLSGMAYAFDQLANFTGENRYRETALKTFKRESALIENGNWTDPGYFKQNRGQHQATWCHGIPGIALGRLLTSNSDLHAEAQAALEALVDGSTNHGLCHGSLGNADILLEAGKRLPNGERWTQLAETLGKQTLAEINKTGWRSAMPAGYEHPGLMTGLAGIGYGFLRLARPKLPNLLALEGPVEK